MARWRAALPAMLTLGRGMRQEGMGGRKGDRIQDNNEIRSTRRYIHTGMQDFLAERAMHGIVEILRGRLRRRCDPCDVAVWRKWRAVNMGLDNETLEREDRQHEHQQKPR